MCSFSSYELSSDLELRNARLWAVWHDTLHRVVFTSENKSEAELFARNYYDGMEGWHIVRFDVSPLYQPLTPTVNSDGNTQNTKRKAG